MTPETFYSAKEILEEIQTKRTYLTQLSKFRQLTPTAREKVHAIFTEDLNQQITDLEKQLAAL